MTECIVVLQQQKLIFTVVYNLNMPNIRSFLLILSCSIFYMIQISCFKALKSMSVSIYVLLVGWESIRFKELIHPHYKMIFSHLLLVLSNHANSFGFICPAFEISVTKISVEVFFFFFGFHSTENLHLKNSTAASLSGKSIPLWPVHTGTCHVTFPLTASLTVASAPYVQSTCSLSQAAPGWQMESTLWVCATTLTN